MMEGIYDAMLLFIGLRLLLGQKNKDKKEMGKRGKRNKKFKIVDDTGLVLVPDDDKPKKPYENFKLPPAREAQSKPLNLCKKCFAALALDGFCVNARCEYSMGIK